MKLPEGVAGKSLQYLVSGAKAAVRVKEGWVSFEVKSILDHEVIVLS